ncbi:MAG: Flp family type IVb pilin [bacterium]|nr:Flp family type IVb pilin [bacterium]
MKKILSRLRSERGASLVEYALVAVLFAIPSVAAIGQIESTMNDDFDSIEASSSSDPLDFSTTSTAPTTSHPEGTPTTTSTTAAPASTTSTTSSTTTTTAAPPTSTTSTTSTTTTTTTTAAPGGGGETPIDPAPAHQTETVDTDGGWITFELDNGEISIDSYSLERGWQGNYEVNEDGTQMTVWLWHRRDGSEITITTWVDEDGYLQTHVDS